MDVRLEHQLKWEHLTERQQEKLVEGMKLNNLQVFIDECSVELPSFFQIQVPAQKLDPRHPPQAMANVQVTILPKPKPELRVKVFKLTLRKRSMTRFKPLKPVLDYFKKIHSQYSLQVAQNLSTQYKVSILRGN